MALNYLSNFQFSNGNYLEIQDLDISYLGSVSLYKPKLHLKSPNQNDKNKLEASEFLLDVSLLNLLFSNLQISMLLKQVNFEYFLLDQKLIINKGSWKANINLTNFNTENLSEMEGNISIHIKGALGNFPARQIAAFVLPNKIGKFLIESAIVNLDIKNGFLNIKKFTIQTNIGDIIITGKIPMVQSLQADINIKLQLQKFYKKKPDNAAVLKILLLAYTKTDGNIEFNCKGGFSSNFCGVGN